MGGLRHLVASAEHCRRRLVDREKLNRNRAGLAEWKVDRNHRRPVAQVCRRRVAQVGSRADWHRHQVMKAGSRVATCLVDSPRTVDWKNQDEWRGASKGGRRRPPNPVDRRRPDEQTEGSLDGLLAWCWGGWRRAVAFHPGWGEKFRWALKAAAKPPRWDATYSAN